MSVLSVSLAYVAHLSLESSVGSTGPKARVPKNYVIVIDHGNVTYAAVEPGQGGYKLVSLYASSLYTLGNRTRPEALLCHLT